jgi:hypothetical protein
MLNIPGIFSDLFYEANMLTLDLSGRWFVCLTGFSILESLLVASQYMPLPVQMLF